MPDSVSRDFAFEGEVLARAIEATFARRGAPLPTGLPVALTEEFARDRTKGTQWKAFVRKTGAADAGQLPDVVGGGPWK